MVCFYSPQLRSYECSLDPRTTHFVVHKFEENHDVPFPSPARPADMLRCALLLLLSFLPTFASSKSEVPVIDHGVLQCTTKAFTSAWSETFNNLVGLTPNYTPGTFIVVDCTQIPNMHCNAIPENAKCQRKYCVCCEQVITGHLPGPVGVGCKRVFS